MKPDIAYGQFAILFVKVQFISSLQGAFDYYLYRMSVPSRPDPPVVGKVTHNSIELYWKLPEACEEGHGDSRVRYCVQEEELGQKSRGFGNVYSGYSRM